MKIFLTLLALVWYLEATMLDISGRPYFCVFKGLTPGILHISVEFVGEKQKSGKIQLFEPESDVDLINIDALDHYAKDLVLSKSGEYLLCFTNLDMSKKSVSFYMLHSEEVKETEKPLGVENVESVVMGLMDIRTKLKQISNNQHMRVEINSIHGDILDDVAKRIKYCFIFKIILAVIIALCQLWVLKAFFNRKEMKATPVSQEMF